MPLDTLQKLNDLLKVEEIREQLPEASTFPLDISVSEIFDQDGEEAYQVVLLFSDRTKDKDLQWPKISPLVEWIRERIFENGDRDRWPYFRYRRESDLKPST